MTDEQQAEIHSRHAAVAGHLHILSSTVLMRGVYDEVGDHADEVEGCTQTARAAIAAIETNLDWFRELLKQGEPNG